MKGIPFNLPVIDSPLMYLSNKGNNVKVSVAVN